MFSKKKETIKKGKKRFIDNEMESSIKTMDTFEEKVEEIEEEEVSDEEIELAEMGIIPKKIYLFLEQYPNKHIFYRGKLTKMALKYYLGIVNKKELENVQQFKLPEDLQEIYAKKFAEGVTEVVTEEKEDRIISLKKQLNLYLLSSLAVSTESSL